MYICTEILRKRVGGGQQASGLLGARKRGSSTADAELPNLRYIPKLELQKAVRAEQPLLYICKTRDNVDDC